MKTLSNAFKKSLFGPIDLFDCGTRMVNTIGPRIANDEKGSRMTDYLKGELVNLNIATERTRARPQTVLIMEKDAKRDELLFMLRDTLKGNTHNVMNPEFREAANALSKLYADHIGNVNSMGGARRREQGSTLPARCAFHRRERTLRNRARDRSPHHLAFPGAGRNRGIVRGAYQQRTHTRPEHGKDAHGSDRGCTAPLSRLH